MQDKMTEWLQHPAFPVVINLVLLAFFFGSMSQQLSELQRTTAEIKQTLTDLNGRKEQYAETFSEHEQRIRALERVAYSSNQ